MAAPGFPADVRATLDALRRIVQALRVSSRESQRRVGLSAAQLFALQQLATMPGASVNELAARTFTHQSSVSVVVRKLVERRLVAKVAATADRRRVRLALTDSGRALLGRSPEPAQERLIAALAALPPVRRHLVAEALTEVAQTMIDSSAPPPMLFEDRRDRPRTLRGSNHHARRGPAASARRG